MKKPKTKKLVLATQTIHLLDTIQLAHVAGGVKSGTACSNGKDC